MSENIEFEKIDLCKLNISLESIDSVCNQICDLNCSEIKNNSYSQCKTINHDSVTDDIEKLNISLDSIDLDPNTLKDISTPMAKSYTHISKGTFKSVNLFNERGKLYN